MTSPMTPTPTDAPTIADLIVSTPGVCSGEPRIAGTRIKVRHVYVWIEEMGMTPAQVVTEYPQLSKVQIHAALAYYWSHIDEIRRDMEESERLAAEVQTAAGPSKIAERLANRGAADDSRS